MFKLALWARGLRLMPHINKGASTWRYVRDMDGQSQHWTVVITGRQAHETWTAGQETIGETTTSLMFRDEAAWITARNVELHAAGWRILEIGPDTPVRPATIDQLLITTKKRDDP
ncbi:hypothetical protein ACQP1K_00360 [Sphaerimonospora sp. CA-214678]|uniref:hypothetical protein n=1 Tax=Sphaerimonospora sp. CA-214678 TaxID=3240029 RepID=UPI003D8DCF38